MCKGFLARVWNVVLSQASDDQDPVWGSGNGNGEEVMSWKTASVVELTQVRGVMEMWVGGVGGEGESYFHVIGLGTSTAFAVFSQQQKLLCIWTMLCVRMHAMYDRVLTSREGYNLVDKKNDIGFHWLLV